MATYCYGHACWSRVLWLLIYDTRIRETSNNHANDKMPPQKDREDALTRGTYHSWIIITISVILITAPVITYSNLYYRYRICVRYHVSFSFRLLVYCTNIVPLHNDSSNGLQ